MESNNTFAGIPEKYSGYDKAKIVLIPVSYGETSIWGKGAQEGPQALLKASEQLELYDIETETEVYKQGIHKIDTITGNSSPEDMVATVHTVTKKNIKRNKFVTLIGGGHAISIGAIRAFNECFADLTVLQIDAHANLRKEHNGSRYASACALYEASQTTNLVQIGIRSMDASEKTVVNGDTLFFAHEMATDDYWMDNAIELITDSVYITFDLDGLDPSIVRATENPQPGGLFWYETLEFLKKVYEEKNVVGFDMVGLCPNESDKASDLLAAKLYYKMLCYKFAEKNIGDENENQYAFKGDERPNHIKLDEDSYE